MPTADLEAFMGPGSRAFDAQGHALKRFGLVTTNSLKNLGKRMPRGVMVIDFLGLDRRASRQLPYHFSSGF